MIAFKNVSVVFDRELESKTVLKNVTFEIKAGEFVTLIGGNGAGKTTLMNVLCGELLPGKGRVVVDDQDVTKLASWRRSHLVSRVFQDPMVGTCPTLTIEENMALAMKRGQKRSWSFALNREARDHFRHTLERLKLGLENRLDQLVGSLSGGQRQALSLIMATSRPAKILVLDEHTAALDPKTAHKIIQLTKELVEEQQLTTLMVTHSMAQAITLGTRTLMLHEGRIVKDVSGDERSRMKEADLHNLFFDMTHQVV